MVRDHPILPAILRAVLFIYLLFQTLAMFTLVVIFLFFAGLEISSTDSSSDYGWLWISVFIFLGYSSAILNCGLFPRERWGKWRHFFFSLAMANAMLFAIPILHIHKFYMSWQVVLLYGVPFLMNMFVLGVVLSRRLHAYIFPPKACSPKPQNPRPA